MLSRSWTFLRYGGLSFVIFTKNKEGVGAVRVMKYKKYVAGKYTRARAPLVRKYTNRIFESKDGTKSMKIVNYVERHNFFWNDLLTKSNRTEIQSYEVEEQTFGTPCITFLTVRGRVLSQTLTTRRLCCHFSHYMILKPSQSAGVHTDSHDIWYICEPNWAHFCDLRPYKRTIFESLVFNYC